ncbi:MAG: glutamate--tRNA ligase [Desulfovibrio sp.]
MTKIVTRFAPSPTGYLHIGGARTALFSWLLARHAGGEFVLRVEDTDRERSTQEATDAILDSMKWLGLDWDGEPVYQSQRADLHNEYIDQMLANGKAYYCECTRDELDAMREKAMKEKRKPKYDGTCRGKDLEAGEGRVVRLKAPQDGRTQYVDMVKGPLSVENAELDDLILRRGDGTPTYNLAVVVDDHTMGVTHVLRGDDHVNNTFRQKLIYEALGWEVPTFGHVPMILGPDKKKLSKRHGALSVMEYEKLGYLPEAMFNYLARLGWSHGDQEIFSQEELISLFTTDNLGSSAAVFDTKKLEWLCNQYIKEADPSALAELVKRYLPDTAGNKMDIMDLSRLEKFIPILQPRSNSMIQMAEMAEAFLVNAEDMEFDEASVTKCLNEEGCSHLAALREAYAAIDSGEFTHDPLEAATTNYLESNELKFKAIGPATRVALTGKKASPGGLFEIMEYLGKEESMNRIDRALSLVD